ncbi:hypothetical protein KQX54_000111 [Cotesia glomerata]|uniref:Uncharacterized protein n=1 Tax=Cotesia glomerata TaxID=32391 RepID=A0AAV7IW97_COTGL|nr:hypothetical protein KQX54_000111 [Cotesia glomerata]
MTDWRLIERYIDYDLLQLTLAVRDGISLTNLPIISIGGLATTFVLRHDLEAWFFRLFGMHNITDRRYCTLNDYDINIFLNLNIDNLDDGLQVHNVSVEPPPQPPTPSLPTPSTIADQIARISRYYSWAQEPMGMRQMIGRWLLQSSTEMLQQQQLYQHQRYEEEEQQQLERRQGRRRQRIRELSRSSNESPLSSQRRAWFNKEELNASSRSHVRRRLMSPPPPPPPPLSPQPGTSRGFPGLNLQRLRYHDDDSDDDDDEEELNVSPPRVRRRLMSPPPSLPEPGTSRGLPGLNLQRLRFHDNDSDDDDGYIADNESDNTQEPSRGRQIEEEEEGKTADSLCRYCKASFTIDSSSAAIRDYAESLASTEIISRSTTTEEHFVSTFYDIRENMDIQIR